MFDEKDIDSIIDAISKTTDQKKVDLSLASQEQMQKNDKILRKLINNIPDHMRKEFIDKVQNIENPDYKKTEEKLIKATKKMLDKYKYTE